MAVSKRKKWGIALILLPGSLLVLVLLTQLLVRFAFVAAEPGVCMRSSDSVAGCRVVTSPTTTAKRVVNIFTILIGATAVIGFVPSVVGGILLLSTGGSTPAVQEDAPNRPPPVA